MCDETEAEFESWLIHEHGMEGFGRWTRLQQIVAKTMNRTPRCSAAYPVSEWARFLAAKANKLETYLKSLEDQGQISLKRTGNILEIEVPNLLKKRDEYTSKSGHSPEFVPSDSGVSPGPDIYISSVSKESSLQENEKEDSSSTREIEILADPDFEAAVAEYNAIAEEWGKPKLTPKRTKRIRGKVLKARDEIRKEYPDFTMAEALRRVRDQGDFFLGWPAWDLEWFAGQKRGRYNAEKVWNRLYRRGPPSTSSPLPFLTSNRQPPTRGKYDDFFDPPSES